MRLSLKLLFFVALVPVSVEGKFAVHTVGKPLSREETQTGAAGFDCLKDLFGEEGEHILTEPSANHNQKYSLEEQETLTEQERHETIYRIFGQEGIDSICGITRKLRKARLLRPTSAKATPEFSTNSERRTQACVPVQPLYPSENDIGNTYNDWAKTNVDPYLPDGADRTSRTDPNKLITDIQGSIDASLEAEYSAMACYPIMNGIASLASIPDFVVFQQGSIVHGIKNLVCSFGTRVSNYATSSLYKQLALAQSHDYYIDGAESRATYMNTANMVNQVCATNGRLDEAVEDLQAIKRTLKERRA